MDAPKNETVCKNPKQMLKLVDKNMMKEICYGFFISGITIHNTCQNGLPLTCLFINSVISDMNEKALKVMLIQTEKHKQLCNWFIHMYPYIWSTYVNELVMYVEGNPVH